jgi:hypothetical protein
VVETERNAPLTVVINWTAEVKRLPLQLEREDEA